MTKHNLIIKSVQVITGVTLAEMRQKTRRRVIVDARKLLCGVRTELMGREHAALVKELNCEGAHYCDHATVIYYIREDASTTDKVYLANRRDIIKRVERLYIPEATAKEAWGNLWEGVASPCLI